MLVTNLRNPCSGNPVANQYLIEPDRYKAIFQSYETTIAVWNRRNNNVYIDLEAFEHSRTTSKYIRVFLNGIGVSADNVKRIRKNIRNGIPYHTKNTSFYPCDNVEAYL